jgi:hypothetical protein
MPIEHFSKWLKLIPLSYCSSEETTYAYLDKVFNRFGALVKFFLTKVQNSMVNFKNYVGKH